MNLLTQIITAFKQYIAIPNTDSRDRIEMDSPTRLLTQDSYVTPNKKPLKRIGESANTILPSDNDSTMNDAEQPNNSPKQQSEVTKSSNHDTNTMSLYSDNE